MFMTGCGSEIAMKFTPGDISTYRSSYQTEQSVILDMVKETSAKDSGTSKKVEVTFAQEIQSINEDLAALAKITIVDIKYYYKDNKGGTFSFDSTNPADKKRSLNALIGKSYTINISSDGSVTPANVAAIRSVRVTGVERRIAQSLLDDKEIIKRHQVPLPGKDVSKVNPGRGWSKVVWSHPMALSVKAFEKSYVLKSIKDDRIANVSMEAYETGKIPQGAPPKPGLFSMFSKAFDTQEKYNGQMQIDIESGKVLKWTETFDASYVVTEAGLTNVFKEGLENNKDASSASLKMGLINKVSLEKLD